MELVIRGGEIEIAAPIEFDPDKTFGCGQCFRWERDESGGYVGVAEGLGCRVRRDGPGVFVACGPGDFERVWRRYFDLDRDYAAIRESLYVDEFTRKAAMHGAGIRILRQNAWEALCSFIVSQCNNIPRIKRIIDALCREFGDPVSFEGHELYAFPPAARLAPLSERDLAGLRCGYRAEYIIAAAGAVASGCPDLEALARGSLPDACAELKKLRGVGDKVALCAALFGLGMMDAFPVDVWMKRALALHYGKEFDPGVFSPHAGIAQQYIYYYMREAADV